MPSERKLKSGVYTVDRFIREMLWDLLDDIDTLTDRNFPSEGEAIKEVYNIAKRRFDISSVCDTTQEIIFKEKNLESLLNTYPLVSREFIRKNFTSSVDLDSTISSTFVLIPMFYGLRIVALSLKDYNATNLEKLNGCISSAECKNFGWMMWEVKVDINTWHKILYEEELSQILVIDCSKEKDNTL